jgi:hypothetical protein
VGPCGPVGFGNLYRATTLWHHLIGGARGQRLFDAPENFRLGRWPRRDRIGGAFVRRRQIEQVAAPKLPAHAKGAIGGLDLVGPLAL